MTAHRIAVAGSSGRMGRMLIEAIDAAPDCVLSGALDRAGAPTLGHDAGSALGLHTGCAVTAELDAGLRDARFLIDFTRPEATLAHLDACVRLGVAMVIGTTGFDADALARIRAAAARIPIVLAPNMSVGVNVVLRLLEQAARALSEGYDI